MSSGTSNMMCRAPCSKMTESVVTAAAIIKPRMGPSKRSCCGRMSMSLVLLSAEPNKKGLCSGSLISCFKICPHPRFPGRQEKCQLPRNNAVGGCTYTLFCFSAQQKRRPVKSWERPGLFGKPCRGKWTHVSMLGSRRGLQCQAFLNSVFWTQHCCCEQGLLPLCSPTLWVGVFPESSKHNPTSGPLLGCSVPDSAGCWCRHPQQLLPSVSPSQVSLPRVIPSRDSTLSPVPTRSHSP